MTTTNNDLMRAIGNLEGTMSAIDGKLDNQHTRMNNHGERLGKVENRQAWWAGVAITVSTLLGFLAKKIGV